MSLSLLALIGFQVFLFSQIAGKKLTFSQVQNALIATLFVFPVFYLSWKMAIAPTIDGLPTQIQRSAE